MSPLLPFLLLLCLLTALDLLVPNVVAEYDESRGDPPGTSKDGTNSLIHSGISTSSVSGQTKPTPALDDKDEQTDSEISISSKNKARMLRGSDNPLWRGHSKDSPSQIRKLHQGQRIPPDRERSPITTTLQEQADQK